MDLNATTMLGQGKNIVQAEIDSACNILTHLEKDSKKYNFYRKFES